MKRLISIALVAALTGCAGRAPAPVQTVQFKDAMMDCAAINAEIAADAAKQTALGKEKGDKVAQNVVAGVAGAILFWPALFLMDFQGAADTEGKALESRDQYLATLALQRCAAQPMIAGVPAQAPMLAPVPAQRVGTPITPTTRGNLSIRGAAVTPAMAADVGLSAPRGVMVLSMGTTGAAMMSGMLEHDVILEFNGTAVNDKADMENALASVSSGSRVMATVWRYGAEKSLTVSF